MDGSKLTSSLVMFLVLNWSYCLDVLISDVRSIREHL